MNTERSLRALFEAFVADPHDTHHGPNLVASIFAYARAKEAAAEECGAGMSDKVAVSRPVEAAPTRGVLAGGSEVTAADLRAVPGVFDALASISTRSGRNCAQSDCQDEHPRGITHGHGSPIAREFGRPVNPEDDGA